MSYKNRKGLDEIFRQNRSTAERYGIKALTAVSSLRTFIREGEINKRIKDIINDNYWHGFQHSAGMFALCVGYLQDYGIKRIYFASSFSSKDEFEVGCGSDPTIDEKVRLAGVGICHDGYDMGRTDKLRLVASHHTQTGLPVKLRVCYSASDGTNCCKCEKCLRTIMAIIGESCDPREMGFEYDSEEQIYRRFIQLIKTLDGISYARAQFLMRNRETQTRLRERFGDHAPKELRFFLSCELEDLWDYLEIEAEPIDMVSKNAVYLRRVDDKLFTGKGYLADRLKSSSYYQDVCRDIIENGEKRAAQTQDYWIGNHGFKLDAPVCTGGELIVPHDAETVVFSGWAADFMRGAPLADLFAQIDGIYYPMEYGSFGINLGRRFLNECLAYIMFSGEIPASVLRNAKDAKIRFYMVGWSDGRAYTYPPISFGIKQS